MKVCLTGSHGVGKTTLLKGLVKKLPEYNIQVESLTRKAANNTELNFDTTDLSERKISKLYMDSFLNAPNNFIASRHMIDVLAYSMYLKKKNNNIEDSTLKTIIEMVEQIKKDKIFDLIIYVPITFKLVEKGEYREGQEDLTYQRDVDTIIKFLLWIHDIPYVTLKADNIENKVNQIVDCIKGGK